MKKFARFLRPILTLAVACASAMTLNGCGDKVLESRQTDYLLADPLENRPMAQPKDHQRRGNNKILRAPLIVGEPVVETGQPLPVMRLLKVKIDILPPIDCENPPTWLTESHVFEFPASADETALASLGAPVRSVEVWVVPASVEGAYVDSAPGGDAGRALAMEALYSGDKPDSRATFDAVFEFGPNWLGVPLRQVGLGRTVLFPPSQNCSHATRTDDDRLPTHAVVYGPFDQGSTPDKYIRVPADVPFTARVIEVCPLRLRQTNELREVMGQIHMPRYKIWRFTSNVRGDCAGGEVELAADPLTSRVRENKTQPK